MIVNFTWQNCPPEKLLAERFHITTGFHPRQRDIIERLVKGKRVLTIQRTGWGKSLCYQMASLYQPHLTVVFTPLKALMRDQCQRCNHIYRIPAAILSSDASREENLTVLCKAAAGHLKVLFIAPERLNNGDWQEFVPRLLISMIVIDEAHCISVWGHDFRPDYLRIKKLLAIFPKSTPILALTATANKRVEEDILQQVGADTEVVRGTMHRPNLNLNVVTVNGEQEKLSYLKRELPRWQGIGIIYTATKKDAERIATVLRQQNIAVEYYHADRDSSVRQEIEQKFMDNRYKVICSTNALGMGIDKADVRFIIHYHMPASPIHYYQEMGRAGRDGQISQCILLYDPRDWDIQSYFIDNSKPESRYYETVMALLNTGPKTLDDILLATGYKKIAARAILKDLEDQGITEYKPRDRSYTAISSVSNIDFSTHSLVRAQKYNELLDMQKYAQLQGCYMEYLTTYLGDQGGYRCGNCGYCKKENFPVAVPLERMKKPTAHFSEEKFLPNIEKRTLDRKTIHEAGWALSYYGGSRIGNLVRISKYGNAGSFPEELVLKAIQVIQTCYPVKEFNGIVSVPPTKSGPLVEQFARQVAALLGKEYLAVVARGRLIQEQKNLTNAVQKADNVKGAFYVHRSELVAGLTPLLVDDIFDSGYILQEVSKTLMQAGARTVYPFTITRTNHSDNQ